MEKHKERALSSDCICNTCPVRFQCFTQERVFSDPIYQALFEVLMAQGKSREEALEEVSNDLKFRIGFPPVDIGVGGTFPGNDWQIVDGSSAGDSSWENDSVSITDDSKSIYTMYDGKEIDLDDSKVRVHL